MGRRQHNNGRPHARTRVNIIGLQICCKLNNVGFLVVTLTSSSGSQFRGFFLQARKPNDNTASYGTFDVARNADAQTLDCFGGTDVS